MTNKLMPQKPTEEMLLAGSDAQYDKDGGRFWADPIDIYKAMYESAPKVEQEPQCNVSGSWLWCKLMDYCKFKRLSPANENELFAICGEAHKQYVDQSQHIAELESQLSECVSALENLRDGNGLFEPIEQLIVKVKK